MVEALGCQYSRPQMCLLGGRFSVFSRADISDTVCRRLENLAARSRKHRVTSWRSDGRHEAIRVFTLLLASVSWHHLTVLATSAQHLAWPRPTPEPVRRWKSLLSCLSLHQHTR